MIFDIHKALELRSKLDQAKQKFASTRCSDAKGTIALTEVIEELVTLLLAPQTVFVQEQVRNEFGPEITKLDNEIERPPVKLWYDLPQELRMALLAFAERWALIRIKGEKDTEPPHDIAKLLGQCGVRHE